MGRHVVPRNQCSNKVIIYPLPYKESPDNYLVIYLRSNNFISVRVSNELGSGHPRAAKFAVIITIVQSLCIGITFMCTIMLTRDHFAAIFTDSKDMQKAVSRLAYLVGITMVLNSVHPVISGT